MWPRRVPIQIGMQSGRLARLAAGLRVLALLALLVAWRLAGAAPIEDPDLRQLLSDAPTARDYPGADAVWLLREMEIDVAGTGEVAVREHKLITLLSEQAFSLAHWEIPYDKSCETLEVRTARTLLNGVAFDVKPDQVAESAVYAGIAWYDALVLRRFVLPAITVGSTLEVETLFRRPVPRVPGDFSTRLQLQQRYAVREARYTVRVPDAMRLTVRFTGGPSPAVSERVQGKRRVYRWTVRDLPALRVDEPQAPPIAELAASARIASARSWAPVTDWYQKITAGKDEVTEAIRRVAAERTAGCNTRDEKIAALHRAVRELPYVVIEMGNLSDAPHSADQALRQQYGDCKDKATLLRALLRAVGIPSDYALVRTADKGRLDRELYSPAEFNHVILALPTPAGDRFLDVTLADVPPTLLPAGVEGADALIIRGAGEVVSLPVSSAEDNRTEVEVTVDVKADGSAAGRAVITFTGQTAIVQRGLLAGVPKDRYREALADTLAPRLGAEITIDSVDVRELREPERPLTITVDFSSPAYLQRVGEQYLGQLPAFMYANNRYRTAKTRTYPIVQLVATSLRLRAATTLPEGFTVAHLPPAAHYDGPAGRYHDAITADGRTIRFTCELATARGSFPPETLEEFRKWSALLALEGRQQLQFLVKAKDGG